MSSPESVCLTQQQAAMLLPLLQQIAAGNGSPEQRHTSTPSRNSSSSSSCSNNSGPFFIPPISAKQATVSAGGYSTDTSEASCKFSSDELFMSKRQNSKSSESQFDACKHCVYVASACLLLPGINQKICGSPR